MLKRKKLKMIKKSKRTIFVVCLIVIVLAIIVLKKKRIRNHDPIPHVKNGGNIYILQWTDSNSSIFRYMGTGNNKYVEHKCSYKNCFVTGNKFYFKNLTEFDVILFHGPDIAQYDNETSLPKPRSARQKYIFASLESAQNYPLCKPEYENFFNWTWTYKLNSDLLHLYFVVRNRTGNIIGPHENMHWMKVEDMAPVNDTVKSLLDFKMKAAAWFVSSCKTLGERELFVNKLVQELNKYGLSVDIYGKCGTFVCGKELMSECWNMVKMNYFFYLSFESSLSEDYVTEKLLNPLQHYTVPIVYGGANYTRFMPDGIYLDARKLGAKTLAKEMYDIINDKERYYNFFKWRNHYSYHGTTDPDTSNHCKLCKMLNDKNVMQKKSVYKEFQCWWNPRNHKCVKK